jgi:hypothetical protein
MVTKDYEHIVQQIVAAGLPSNLMGVYMDILARSLCALLLQVGGQMWLTSSEEV